MLLPKVRKQIWKKDNEFGFVHITFEMCIEDLNQDANI